MRRGKCNIFIYAKWQKAETPSQWYGLNKYISIREIAQRWKLRMFFFVQLFSNDRSFARPLKEKQGSGSGKCRRGCSVTQKTRQMKQKWMEKSCLPI